MSRRRRRSVCEREGRRVERGEREAAPFDRER